MYEEITEPLIAAARELADKAALDMGDIVVVGCSTSELLGEKIGTASAAELGVAVYAALKSVFAPMGVYIAAQCCEHLNRAIIIELAAAGDREICNVVPQPKAGGSFATAAYAAMEKPVAVEAISAKAGMDIGDTLIGMHIRRVAVPVRLSVRKIGGANLVCARSRAKFIGGERAHYDSDLK